MNNLTTNPLVSVIVPVFNGAPYLRQCMDSICNQTLKEIEIICVDDGSTDDSLSILQEYSAKDGRVIVLQQQNLYAGTARNNGMKIARGKYYSFLDADDYFEEDMLKCLTEAAEAHEVDMVLCAADVYREAENRITQAPWLLRTELLGNIDFLNFSPSEVLGDRLYEIVKLAPWNKLFRADFVRQFELVWSPEPRANDVLFVGSALAAARTMAVVPKKLIHYRIRQDSISHSKTKSTEAHVKAFSALKKALIKLKVGDKVMHSFNLCYMASLLWDCDTLDMDAARKFLQLIINEIEPREQLLLPPGYDNAVHQPLVECRYKSLVNPQASLICVESGTSADEGWDSLLAGLLSIKDADFNIVCLSESEKSTAGNIFKSYGEKDIRCISLTGDIIDNLTALQGDSPNRYFIVMDSALQFDADEIRNVMHKLGDSSLKKGKYSYYRIKKKLQFPPKVSVIIPVYSGREYFAEMINRLQNQTLKDIEIIFVDDKGSDGSFELALAAAKDDDRIVLIQNERNEGPGASRNYGIERATGEFIAFVDADDLIPIDYYERLYCRAKETGALVVKASRAKLYDNGTIEISTHNSDIQKKLANGEHLVNSFGWEHTTAIYNRAHVMRNEARNSDCLQDEDTSFIMKTLHNLQPNQFCMLDDLFYYYRMHDSSVTHVRNASYLFESIKSMEDKLNYIYTHTNAPALNTYAAVLVEGRVNWRFKDVIHSTLITYQNRVDYLTRVCEIIREYQRQGWSIPLYGVSKNLVMGHVSAADYIASLTKPAPPQPKEAPKGVHSAPVEAKLMHRMALISWGEKLKRRYKRYHLLSLFSCGKKRRRYKAKKAECKARYAEYKQIMKELRGVILDK